MKRGRAFQYGSEVGAFPFGTMVFATTTRHRVFRSSTRRARGEPPRPRDFLRPHALLRGRGDDPRLPEEPGHRVRRLRANAEPIPAGFRRAISGQSRRANATKTWERTKKRTRGVLESGWGRTGGDALGTVDLQAHVFVPVDLCRWRGMPGKVGQSGATEGGGRARDGRAANVSG